MERLTEQDFNALIEITQMYGISLSRLRDLAESDMDGRLLVLPCKVGDPVWLVEPQKQGNYKILAEKVMGFPVGITTTYRYYAASPLAKHIGKLMPGNHLSVFLTREEAETALGGKVNEV